MMKLHYFSVISIILRVIFSFELMHLLLSLPFGSSTKINGDRPFFASAYNPPPLIDRIPTYRIYQKGRCLIQVPGRGEVNECRNRLHEAITSFAPSRVRTTGTDNTVRPLIEIESQAALDELLNSSQEAEEEGGVMLLEFYGKACKQCALLHPMFASLPYVYRDRMNTFYRADVTRFPSLVIPPPDPSTFIGLDRSADIEARLEGCPRCGGTGFVPCGECEGKGHVVKTVSGYSLADICMICVGHKKVPCSQCGGKCYLC